MFTDVSFPLTFEGRIGAEQLHGWDGDGGFPGCSVMTGGCCDFHNHKYYCFDPPTLPLLLCSCPWNQFHLVPLGILFEDQRGSFICLCHTAVSKELGLAARLLLLCFPLPPAP